MIVDERQISSDSAISWREEVAINEMVIMSALHKILYGTNCTSYSHTYNFLYICFKLNITKVSYNAIRICTCNILGWTEPETSGARTTYPLHS